MCTSPMIRYENIFSHEARILNTPTLEDAKNLYNRVGDKLTEIPCGKCVECRLKYSQEWAFRCVKEAELYEHNEMVTLTYSDEYLTKNKGIDLKTGELVEKGTLVKKDVQDFIKRLRKAYKGQKIRYYMCGEYGEEKGRPHYHIIFFNLKVEDKEFWKYSKCDWTNEKNKLYKSKKIQKLWGKGIVELNEVNYETCAYVARYVMKKIKGKYAAEQYEDMNILPEYTCMSRKPGIGQAYFMNNQENFEKDIKAWVKTKNGLKQQASIRYFDKQLEKINPEALEEIKQQRKQNAEERMQEILRQTDLTRTEYMEQRHYKSERKDKNNIRVLI